MKQTPPPRLYKYEPITVQTLCNIKTNIIYFGSPRKFNDPYDCAFLPKVVAPNDDELQLIRDSINSGKFGLPQVPHAAAAAAANPEMFRRVLIEMTTTAIKQAGAEFLDKMGVSCLSETPGSLLMWAHYAEKSQGFCLEFDTTQEPFNKAEKVDYKPEIPSVRVSELFLSENGMQDLIEKLFFTKSSWWSYEREWRLLHYTRETKYCYDSKCLTGIYFGPDARRESIEIICSIMQGQHEKVSFYKTRRNEERFDVDFEKFTYINHLETKRTGRV